MAVSNEFFGSDHRSPVSSYECKRLFSRISKIIVDSGLKITDKSYEDPEDFLRRVLGTPGENDPNAFIEINNDSSIEMHGFTSDSYDSPEVSLDGSLPEDVVSKIKKSVESVEGWKFFNLSRSVNESSSKGVINRTFYRGYVILRRDNVKTGEVSYDVVNPKKGRSPVWTDLGSEVEAKRWINKDISSKSESLKESNSVMDYERILREVTKGVQLDGNLTRAIGTSDLQMDILPTDDAINRVVSSAESMGFKEVSREIDERPENDSWIVLVKKTNEGRCVIGIVFNAEYDYAWVTAGDSDEYDDYFEESSKKSGSGVKDCLTESSTRRRISLDPLAHDLPGRLYNSLIMEHDMTVERVSEDVAMPWDSDLTIKGGYVFLDGGVLPGGSGFGSCTVKIPVEKFNECFTISVSSSVEEIKDDLEDYGWDVK